MSEYMPQSNPEMEAQAGLMRLVGDYFPDDKGFIEEMDFDDALGFIYGQLLEAGEDPGVVLVEYGITEEGEGNEV